MCGIVGYVGGREIMPILIGGLRRLEYRGYDSAGVAVLTSDGVWMRKAEGKIAALESEINGEGVKGAVGIGHTRWATHGAPTRENAHPHVDHTGHFLLVHNGIIDNYLELRREVQEAGFPCTSDTDSEVLVQLIASVYEDSLERAVRGALARVEGTFGIAVVSDRDPEVAVVARRGSPLVIGLGEDETFFASDIAALVAHTRQVVYLADNEMAVIRAGSFITKTIQNQSVDKPVHEVDWDLGSIERDGYDHFMLKEIHEQPRSVADTMRGRLDATDATARLNGLNLTPADTREIKRVVFLACGTSWHAALVGECMFEALAGIPTEVEYASEFRYRRSPLPDPGTLFIALSQSGETADTLAALREARRRGSRAIGLVNVVGSTIARETDGGVYLHAGPEIGVASTKAFTSQLAALAMMALKFGRAREISEARGVDILRALNALPAQIEQTLKVDPLVRSIAERYSDRQNFLYLGRGYNFPVALEGALKLKEISYIHAEGYPAAEMKHGPIALIDAHMPVVFIATQDAIYDKILANIQEVRARKGRVIVIASEGDEAIGAHADHVIHIPRTLDFLTPILAVIPLQLLAYHIAVLRKCDVDQPRNLAKSVTVE